MITVTGRIRSDWKMHQVKKQYKLMVTSENQKEKRNNFLLEIHSEQHSGNCGKTSMLVKLFG